MISDRQKKHWGGHWGEHPEFPVENWQEDVVNGDTRLGYWSWVEVKIADMEALHA
jgi:hypothetical protein